MKKQLFTLAILFVSSLMMAQTQTENYIHTATYQVPTRDGMVTDHNKIETITYYDGLGRPKQSIAQRAGGGGEDLITHTEYDALGRQPKQYLPYARPLSSSDGSYFSSNVKNLLNNQYRSKFPKDFSSDTRIVPNPYSEMHYEASPLNRVLEQAAPGEDWKLNTNTDTDHTIKFQYATNGSNEVWDFEVLYNNTTNTLTPQLVLKGRFAANQLYKTITKDENWQPTDGNYRTTIEYKNKQGQVILKRNTIGNANRDIAPLPDYLDTYYIYDDYGNLIYVLSPEASKAIITGSSLAPNTQDILDTLCYQYTYDYRNRLVRKKIPGKGVERIIYDALDRPIMTQDAHLKLTNEWLFTKYDVLGRIAYTGIIFNPESRNAIQATQTTTNAPLYETQTNTASNDQGNLDTAIHYTNNVSFGWATAPLKILTVNYYDTYVDHSGIAIPTTIFNTAVTQNTKTLPTVSKVRVLGTNDWTTTLTGYDAKARAIYVASHNQYLNTTDVVENLLDFTGKPLETKTTHSKGNNPDIITRDYFTYDHQARLLTHLQQLDDSPIQLIANHTYDNLGQLISKKVGGELWETGYTGFQNVDTQGNRIYKTHPSNTWNAGLFTKGVLAATAQGGISFTTSVHGKRMVIGFNDVSNNSGFGEIDYAFNFYNNTGGFYRIRVEGANTSTAKLYYNKGDTFAIEKDGNDIIFLHNHQEVHRHTITTGVVDMVGDTAFYTADSEISNLQFYATEVTEYLQKISYTYNVRGWLTDINNIKDPAAKSRLFDFHIAYNRPEGADATPLYNGNIAETQWKTKNTDNTIRGYNYSYDDLNRITQARSLEMGTIKLERSYRYDVANIHYDFNGNILQLKRNGSFDDDVHNLWDDLQYTYSGNQLMRVDDGVTTHNEGFIDGNANSTDDYTYDDNGNMTRDANKGITSITYNHLNLPTTVQFNNDPNKKISYIYDATGVKLKKIVEDNTGVDAKKVEYAAGYVYSNNADANFMDLQFIPHPEGYTEPLVTRGVRSDKSVKGTNALGETTYSNYQYTFQYKDHLGNVRLSYSDADLNGAIDPDTEIIEENNYYPFGLKQKGYNDVVNGGNDLAQNWKFGNKELNQELGLEWYDFGARNYNASLGRWMNIDPLADKYYEHSTYAYTVNSPILFVDPDGQRVEWADNIDPEDAKLIGALIYNLRKNSKSFDKAFTKLHESDAVYRVGTSDNLAGGHGLFFPSRAETEKVDENGDVIVDLYGNFEMEPGTKGGDITFDLNQIRKDGLNPSDIVPEEFAHAYSHDYYTEGGEFENYNKRPALGNFEYEGQVISGIFKKEAGIRVHPNEPTSIAELYGRSFNVKNFQKSIENWYNNSNNFYRTHYRLNINSQQLPSSVLQILKKDEN